MPRRLASLAAITTLALGVSCHLAHESRASETLDHPATVLGEHVTKLAVCPAPTRPGANYVVADDEDVLCRFGSDEPSFSGAHPSELRLVVWNLYKGAKEGLAEDAARLLASSDLALFQEVMIGEPWDHFFAKREGMGFLGARTFYYSDGSSTGVALGSRHPFAEAGWLRSADGEPFTGTPKMSLWGKIQGPGTQTTLVISVHMINFVLGMAPFENQLAGISRVIEQHEGPVIVGGDFNTWRQARLDALEKVMRLHGLTETEMTDGTNLLALDHLYVRGLHVKSQVAARDITSSDHFPILATLVPCGREVGVPCPVTEPYQAM
jgi:endonuclease/exonuclease/phosphatase (EEP) superfamily protein YafD